MRRISYDLHTYQFSLSLNVTSTDVYRVLKHVEVTNRNSMECTSVAETEDKVDEKVQPPREKVEKATMQDEETRARKPTEEQVPQQPSMRAEESGTEGNLAN